MSEEKIEKALKLLSLLDSLDNSYYDQIEPDNEYAEEQAAWDKGYEHCWDALDSIITRLELRRNAK
jgi:hypothetical protein